MAKKQEREVQEVSSMGIKLIRSITDDNKVFYDKIQDCIDDINEAVEDGELPDNGATLNIIDFLQYIQFIMTEPIEALEECDE